MSEQETGFKPGGEEEKVPEFDLNEAFLQAEGEGAVASGARIAFTAMDKYGTENGGYNNTHYQDCPEVEVDGVIYKVWGEKTKFPQGEYHTKGELSVQINVVETPESETGAKDFTYEVSTSLENPGEVLEKPKLKTGSAWNAREVTHPETRIDAKKRITAIIKALSAQSKPPASPKG